MRIAVALQAIKVPYMDRLGMRQTVTVLTPGYVRVLAFVTVEAIDPAMQGGCGCQVIGLADVAGTAG